MEKVAVENISITTGVDSLFVEETLTTDIELIDAIFDLIDNSIDAARNKLIREQVKQDSFGLPENYSGCEIALRLSEENIFISDNCSGIDEETLKNRAFIIGKRSNHEHGIGSYGLGLKRALLKAGDNYWLSTDNGSNQYKAKFNKGSLSSSKDIIASKYYSKGRSKTTILIRNLNISTKSQLTSNVWCENLIDQINIRYSLFVSKGLLIKVSLRSSNLVKTTYASPNIPILRDEQPLKNFCYVYEIDNLYVNIVVGVHDEYRFPGEIDHNQTSNKSLTKTFGIYYICNDRVIVSSSKEDKYGFGVSWHSEHNGFICLVHIISADPSYLPWNTAKTDLSLNSKLFLDIKEKVEPMSLEYRSKAKKLINIWKSTKDKPPFERKRLFAIATDMPETSLTPPEVDRNSKALKGNKTNDKKAAKKNNKPFNSKANANSNKKSEPKNKEAQHTQSWEYLLPADFPEDVQGNWIVNNLILEAKDLKLKDHPHAATMLYRALFEAAGKSLVKKLNKFGDVKEHHFTKGEGKEKSFTDEQKAKHGIDIQMIRLWLIDEKNMVFPDDDRSKLTVSLNKMKAHLAKMNGIVHGIEVIGASDLALIRNENIHLLRFMVAHR